MARRPTFGHPSDEEILAYTDAITADDRAHPYSTFPPYRDAANPAEQQLTHADNLAYRQEQRS
ncbi:hypothetical protein ACIBKY_51235 [Nonomuraea sp. NPDC050394]|uniref:hypothetical protein n=1 Tax=Nonomuraea sp. NPDC050394 TaxID=3364363 RepID=UPI003798C752